MSPRTAAKSRKNSAEPPPLIEAQATEDPAPTQLQPDPGELRMIPAALLVPHEDNPRRDLGDLEELAASITAVGILEPLIVSPRPKWDFADPGYTVVAGHRRLAAATLAGIFDIPCIVRKLGPISQAEIMLIENLQRRDLDPLEEANAYRRLIGEMGRTQRELATRLGRSQSHISKRLALLQLPPKALEALDSGGITLTEAAALVPLIETPERLERALDVRQVPGGDVQRAVSRELDQLTREKARAATIADLEAQGVTVVEWPVGGWSRKGISPVAWLGLGVDAAAVHAQEACHAVVVAIHGDPIPVCINPGSHQQPERSDEPHRTLSPEEQAEVEKTRALKERRRAAGEARVAFIRQLVAKPPTARELPEVAAVLALVLIDQESDFGWDTSQIVADWLAITPTEKQTAAGSDDVWEAVAAEATKSPARAVQIAYAMVLAGRESGLDRYYLSGWVDRLRTHVDHLVGRGYHPTRQELEDLDEKEDEIGRRGRPSANEGADADPDPPAAAADGGAAPPPGTPPSGADTFCRLCECTEDDPCEGGCSWVEDPQGLGDLCSACLPNAIAVPA